MVNINDIYWAAGFMEGEGCFSKSISQSSLSLNVSAGQLTLEPLKRLASLFGGCIYTRYGKVYTGGKYYVWYCGSARAAGVAMTLYGLMTKRRKVQIDNSLGAWLKIPIANKRKTHCKHGHEFNTKNTYIAFYPETGKYRGRSCRVCDRIRRKRKYKKKEAN